MSILYLALARFIISGMFLISTQMPGVPGEKLPWPKRYGKEFLNPLGLSLEQLCNSASFLTSCLTTQRLRRTSSTRCLTSFTNLLCMSCRTPCLSVSLLCRESVFGYITVLSGAFSACRYIVLQKDVCGEGPTGVFPRGTMVRHALFCRVFYWMAVVRCGRGHFHGKNVPGGESCRWEM